MRFLRRLRELANTRWDLNPFQIAFLFLIGGVVACVVFSPFYEMGFLWLALPVLMALGSFARLPRERMQDPKRSQDPLFVRQFRWTGWTSLVLSSLLVAWILSLEPITIRRLKVSLFLFIAFLGVIHYFLSIFWGLGMALSSLFKSKPVLTDFDAIDHSRFD